MEPYLEYTESEEAYYARRERRRARMLREKRRRQRRRRIFLLSVVVLLLGVIIAVTVTKAGKKKEDSSRVENEMPSETIQQEQQSAEVSQEESTEAVSDAKPEKVTEAYQFVSNENTRSIYSENIISTHSILINESTDTIIAATGAKDRISPASMTKVLTVLVAAEQISEEQLNDKFTMTIDITDYSYVNDCSNVGFLVGEQVPVKDLFYGTILPSGGDAAVGLATYVAGSHEAFVELMNEKLEELGLSDTAHFTNCVGLYDENHYCTIYDMAVIMKAALQNELCREILKERCYTTTPTEEHPEGITISNWFLRRIEDKETGGEVAGAKTGFVNESGSCAVSYQIADNGTPYICVTAGSSSSWRCIYDHVEIYNQYIPKAE